ncbi:MAG TPA: pyruvate kinase, partial [Pseudomonadales bacterium]|nr:pyruvate kinase [Pseudomonadales bacterium]
MSQADVEDIEQSLLSLRADMVAASAASPRRMEVVHENQRDSARNLLHYLALRRRDLRPLQLRLAR